MKKKFLHIATAMLLTSSSFAQSPLLSSWLVNLSGAKGRHYVEGNSTPISNDAEVNVQGVSHSGDYVYIECSGVPAYIVGPYLDGNPSLATDQQYTFQFPKVPTKNVGAPTETQTGAIGVFINGVLMYDYKDDVSYSFTNKEDSYEGDAVWNRNAILAEMDGFDCSKGHPSPVNFGSGGGSGGPGGGGGTGPGGPGPGGPTLRLAAEEVVEGAYHHHQNPTAFNLDKVVLSDVCDLYVADGLYTLDETKHSPLIGYAFDGYPVYGAYGYANTDGTGGIKLIKSSYKVRSITKRTHYADGTDVTDGPDVSVDFPLGWYKEDYEYDASYGDLDEHNGRFCVTPEYPEGTYAYFATVDDNWNSTYPYMVGPEYYGEVLTQNFTAGSGNTVTVNEPVEVYAGSPLLINAVGKEAYDVVVFPNPTSEIIAVQVKGLLRTSLEVSLFDATGKLIHTSSLQAGSTIWHYDAKTLYDGEYVIQISDGTVTQSEKVIVVK